MMIPPSSPENNIQVFQVISLKTFPPNLKLEGFCFFFSSFLLSLCNYPSERKYRKCSFYEQTAKFKRWECEFVGNGSCRFSQSNMQQSNAYIMGPFSAVIWFSSFLIMSFPAGLDTSSWQISWAMAGNTAWALLKDMQFSMIVLKPFSSF